MNIYSFMAASTPVVDVYLCHYFDKALDALEIEAVFSTDSATPALIHRSLASSCESPFLDLTSEQDTLAAILLLRSRGQHVIHATRRVLNRDRRLYHSESPRPHITHLRLHEAWIEHKGIKPLVLGVDSDPVPKHHCFRWSVRGIRDRRLTAASHHQSVVLARPKILLLWNYRTEPTQEHQPRTQPGRKLASSPTSAADPAWPDRATRGRKRWSQGARRGRIALRLSPKDSSWSNRRWRRRCRGMRYHGSAEAL